MQAEDLPPGALDPTGPEWKSEVTGRPDELYILVGEDNTTRAVGLEWYAYGKQVDLTREANGLPRRTLIRVEGDDRPKFLLGRGWVIDLEETHKTGQITALNMRDFLEQNGGTFQVTIGDDIWGRGAVARILQEDSDAGHAHEAEAGGVRQSPFSDVLASISKLPEFKEQQDRITSDTGKDTGDLLWLLGY